MIDVTCTSCARTWQAGEAARGRTMRCPGCRTPVMVGELVPVAPPAPQASDAPGDVRNHEICRSVPADKALAVAAWLHRSFAASAPTMLQLGVHGTSDDVLAQLQPFTALPAFALEGVIVPTNEWRGLLQAVLFADEAYESAFFWLGPANQAPSVHVSGRHYVGLDFTHVPPGNVRQSVAERLVHFVQDLGLRFGAGREHAWTLVNGTVIELRQSLLLIRAEQDLATLQNPLRALVSQFLGVLPTPSVLVASLSGVLEPLLRARQTLGIRRAVQVADDFLSLRPAERSNVRLAQARLFLPLVAASSASQRYFTIGGFLWRRSAAELAAGAEVARLPDDELRILFEPAGPLCRVEVVLPPGAPPTLLYEMRQVARAVLTGDEAALSLLG